MAPQHPPKTVLVVEDELDMRFFLKTLLETSGYVPIITKNGQEGFSAAQKHRPDLVILDVMMPQEGGALMYRNLKDDPDLCTTPVIMLTAVSGTTFRHFLKMLAAQRQQPVPMPEAHVEKPPDPHRLLRIIQKLTAKTNGP
jgi:CheY-like chemotaxis protein